jgi:major vault protein
MLQESVTLAIDITTRMQEQEAKRIADKKEQVARGALQKQMIEDEATAEKEKKDLFDISAKCESIKSRGLAIAEAKGRAKAAEIEAEAEVRLSELMSTASRIREGGDIDFITKKHTIEIEKEKALKEHEIDMAERIANIESTKFKSIIDSIGADTLVEISNAGPELQAKLLSSLGLSGYVMMDSNNPINLFQAANGNFS